jgi:uncharacterized membrane protein YheB (UPF0754 family)
LLGAGIGWFTNYLAIKMLFHPRKPIRIPFSKLQIQGLLPNRRAQLAEAVSDAVCRELLRGEFLADKLATPRLKKQVSDHIIKVIHTRIERVVPPFIPRGLVVAAMAGMTDAVQKEVDAFFDKPLRNVLGSEETREAIRCTVKERLNSLALEDLEQLVFRLARSEIRGIEIAGAVLGFLIGLLQLALAGGFM